MRWSTSFVLLTASTVAFGLGGFVVPAATAQQEPASAVSCERMPGAQPVLPSVSGGERPGPAVLYQEPAEIPELSNTKPFAAQPLRVSGTDAYRDGEYLYQDYTFDDHGADTVSQVGPPPGDVLAGSTGDVRYPTAQRYAGNAADIVEFRVKPTRTEIVYRITLNTVIEPDVAMVGIGIDTDRSGGTPVAWPGGAGVSTPGMDAFVSAWGTGGVVYRPVSGAPTALGTDAVTMDRDSNQLTVRVPRKLLDPGVGSWRYVVGAGLRGDDNTWRSVPAATSPSERAPASGNDGTAAPAVFNLAFRFDEPQQVVRVVDDVRVGVGLWFEDKQARTLAGGTTGDLAADVDFGALAARADRWIHAPGDTQARLHPSRLELGEGVLPDGLYGGRLQPYILRVPRDCDPARPPGLTLALHGANATHTQWSVFSPNYLTQLGDERDSYVLSPLKRSICCYQPEWYADVFEAWADVAQRFTLDPERVTLSGYSAGGYDTYRLGVEYPDLFADAFPIVGAAVPGVEAVVPGDDTNYRLMTGNVRWVPYLAWNWLTDPIAPWPGAVYTHSRFDELGLRNQLWNFAVGEHFTPAVLDQWQAAANALGDARVVRDPSRVDYGIAPSTWSPDHGLVADHAYWVSGLRVRDDKAFDETNTARGYATAVSGAFGEGDPVTSPAPNAHAGLPGPAVITGTEWGVIPAAPERNALELGLRNLASLTVAGARARLNGGAPLTIRITSDGDTQVSLNLPLPEGTTVTRSDGLPASGVSLSSSGAVFTAGGGTVTYLLTPGRTR